MVEDFTYLHTTLIQTIMIGVRNPKHDDEYNQWQPDDGLEKCLEVWVNELRLSDFNENGGYKK